jgi:hypothetical protein
MRRRQGRRLAFPPPKDEAGEPFAPSDRVELRLTQTPP